MNLLKMISELERDEGLRLKPYLDSATPPRTTIGIGRNLTDRGISREEAYHLLHNDIEGVTADLDQHVPWWGKLDEVRQRVIFNMCFNMGVRKLLEFQRTLAMVEAGDYEGAAAEMLVSGWARQVPIRAHRLADMMRVGLA